MNFDLKWEILSWVNDRFRRRLFAYFLLWIFDHLFVHYTVVEFFTNQGKNSHLVESIMLFHDCSFFWYFKVCILWFNQCDTTHCVMNWTLIEKKNPIPWDTHGCGASLGCVRKKRRTSLHNFFWLYYVTKNNFWKFYEVMCAVFYIYFFFWRHPKMPHIQGCLMVWSDFIGIFFSVWVQIIRLCTICFIVWMSIIMHRFWSRHFRPLDS